MRNKVALGFLAVAVWLVSAASAWAVSLGKIDVASHLGEPFYAEVPLQLDPGESISNVYVELASPADYRILEVYRDPALSAITVDVKTDTRGARVVLSSDSGIESPFFNLVLKVRYERATHFKKYPIFLDIPQMARPAAMKPVPAVKEGQAKTTAPPQVAPVVVSKPVEQKSGSSFKPFDGWARIGRYGPMVYGDTITTVAQRLQIDDRYTRQQVMVALFEKNRAKFDHDNINLIKAGTYLDVPSAAEVERLSPEQARGIIAKQEKEWKQLIKQPKYAAVAEAQKDRYSKRIRVGEKASGVAASPMPSQSTQQNGSVQAVQKPAGENAAANAETAQKQSELQQQIQQLQQQNTDLQGKLTDTQKQLADMSSKSDEAAAAAANARVKKLQIQLARLQAERDEALQKAKSQPLSLGWLTYALLGVIVLLLGLVGFLMRREPKHPATDYPESGALAHDEPLATSGADMFEDAPEIDVEAVDSIDDIDTTATMQMNAADVTKEFTDSIPDLTDEDTGKMEAFEGEIEEEPDPNVDYLAEADVYLRYGMEDEAVAQVKMALKLDPHSADAYIKMAQVLRAKNDQAALDETIDEAKQALGGDALKRFEDAVSNLDEAVVDAFADTMPPTMAEEMPGFEETVAEQTLAETELTAPEEAPAEEAPEASGEEAAAGDLGDLDIEWPEFEDVETPMHEAEAEVAQQKEEAEPEAPSEAPAQPAKPAAEEASAGDMDFDLSDLEIPEADIQAAAEGAESRAASFVDTSDLEKTVAIDWSQETSVDTGEQEEMVSESGTDGLADISLDSAEPEIEMTSEPEPEAEPEPEPEPEPEAEPVAEKKSETPSPIDDGGIDLGDFDFDQAEAEKDMTTGTGDDEFSSTIRTTLVNVEAHSDEDEGPLFDLSSDDAAGETVKISVDDEPSLPSAEPEGKDDESAAQAENESGFVLDLGEDMDETQKLDDLLSEFAEEKEKDDDKKKD